MQWALKFWRLHLTTSRNQHGPLSCAKTQVENNPSPPTIWEKWVAWGGLSRTTGLQVHSQKYVSVESMHKLTHSFTAESLPPTRTLYPAMEQVPCKPCPLTNAPHAAHFSFTVHLCRYSLTLSKASKCQTAKANCLEELGMRKIQLLFLSNYS